MIAISRGREPASLVVVRNAQLPAIRALGREPKSNEINGYRVIADEIWKAQHYKCCYCEFRVQKHYNDVEHYRPKAFADRGPGFNLTHGYWWLAFTWDNLLFACPGCNRSSKNGKFPLENGCQPLLAEIAAPGGEVPLLIDPSTMNPVEHIEFVYQRLSANGQLHWRARAKNNSKFGQATIEVCGLNRDELLEIRDMHVEVCIMPYVTALKKALAVGIAVDISREFNRAMDLLAPVQQHCALNYYALCHYISDAELVSVSSIGWPKP